MIDGTLAETIRKPSDRQRSDEPGALQYSQKQSAGGCGDAEPFHKERDQISYIDAGPSSCCSHH